MRSTVLWTFIAYGIFGWCIEIVWTALYSVGSSLYASEPVDWRLVGTTYLWMFPIYGAGGVLFELAHRQLEAWGFRGLLRGLVYMIGCFTIEALAGFALKLVTGAIPWDYHYARWNVYGLIRLDYAPAWFCFGLLLERIEPLVRAFSAAAAAR